MQIMQELYSDDPDFKVIEELFKHDPALSYRLLRYLNSAAFALRDRVASVGRAITFLGRPACGPGPRSSFWPISAAINRSSSW